MHRKIITTGDGSTTIQIEDWNEQYHSKHGAVREAYHVFIENGLFQLPDAKIAVLEIGFGTGLNALITFLEARKRGIEVHYTGVEAYPIADHELDQLNYVSELDAGAYASDFLRMHRAPWEEDVYISKDFILQKQQKDFSRIEESDRYDLVYFDAFGARVQPELWTEAIFSKMYNALKKSGVLTTYAAKGSVRRAMQAVGFSVDRLPGPPGKREMLRAKKD
ncbi:tRNA (5-methylaminomethyl-2-thiouridine)(34)-methyltransferase MnmD [Pricia sp. S334]|uniref:tRNA (5-methylaminomethyl-2-thiouridine)(34)-methyltransferase MnmD n=1 Tax=Pricia mediterranea TaxID=3076079 RepID=A0ABU3L8C2_9FLAO|nr:tRNA (5-methylaminomethyl-2-thiouridine)(34)-methyltransferase MnmD [Pricia sp. S334]MDT7829727.1 tRNA (5-methylaminomethyl-2-thiouridine)(34)-methyltransferase MnmD [Pricia sp. S334]